MVMSKSSLIVNYQEQFSPIVVILLNLNYMKTTVFSILMLAVFFYGCGNQETSSEDQNADTASTEETSEAPSEPSVTLELASNDQMQYDKSELRVKAGQEVTLILTHTGEQNKEVMGHNFVLLKNETDIPAFGMLASQSKDNDYIPETEAIIAHTSLIGGGESTSITFKAPPRGIYDYICSFPGHYGMMNGKFIVE